jgi:DNA-binding transcriptional regulator YdaS (Cro superfamily)
LTPHLAFAKFLFMKLSNYIKENRGNAQTLCEQLEVSPSFLSQMASGKCPISPQRAVKIEQATNGKVTRQEMRADWHLIWPELVQVA